MVAHRLRDRRFRVRSQVRAEPVRLVVEDVPAAVVPCREVDEAVQEAVDRGVAPGEPVIVALHFEAVREFRALKPVERQVELHLGDGPLEVGQPEHAARLARRHERGLQAVLDQGSDGRQPLVLEAVAGERALAGPLQAFGVRVAEPPLEDLVQAPAGAAAAGEGEDGRAVFFPFRRVGGRRRFDGGFSVGEVDVVAVAHEQAGARGGPSRQGGVARPLPDPFELAFELAGLERSGRLRAGRLGVGFGPLSVGVGIRRLVDHPQRDGATGMVRECLDLRQPLALAQRLDSGGVLLQGSGVVVVDRRSAAVKEPGQRRVFGSAFGRPGHHAAVLRPRQRHVEEPQFVGVLFDMLAIVGVVRWVEIEHRRPVFGVVVVGRRLSVPARRLRAAVPGEGVEDDRELQAFGPVGGDDLHQVLVALEAKLGRFVVGLRVPPRLPEPVEEALTRGPPPALDFVEQIGEVQVVRQPPRAVRVGEQVRRAVGGVAGEQDAPHQRGDAVLLPDFGPLARETPPPAPGVVVVAQRGEVLQVESEQVGGERPAEQLRGVVLRFVQAQGVEEAMEAARLVGLEDVVVADLDAVDPEFVQSCRYRFALGALADEHGDVAGGQGLGQVATRQFRPAVPARRDQARDVLGGLVRGQSGQLRLGSRLAVPLRDQDELERGLIVVLVVYREFPAFPVGRRRSREPEVGEDERPFPREELVDGANESGRRTVVAFQFQRFVRRGQALVSLQIGEHVRAPEAVDRLLGVADDEESPAGRAGAARVDRLEDPGLQPVGVLELVDQGDGVPGADSTGELGSAGPVERAVEFDQQGVEAQAAFDPGGVPQGAAGVLEEAEALACEPQIAIGRSGLRDVVEVVEQRSGRRRVLLVEPRLQRLGAESAGAVRGEFLRGVGIERLDDHPATHPYPCLFPCCRGPSSRVGDFLEGGSLRRVGPFGLCRADRCQPRTPLRLERARQRLRRADPPGFLDLGVMAGDPGRRVFVQHELLRLRVLEQRHGLADHPASPEVARGVADGQRVVSAHFERERSAGMKGKLDERPLAEAVDRRDVRPVDVADGAREASQRVRVLDPAPPPAPPQPAGLGTGLHVGA